MGRNAARSLESYVVPITSPGADPWARLAPLSEPGAPTRGMLAAMGSLLQTGEQPGLVPGRGDPIIAAQSPSGQAGAEPLLGLANLARSQVRPLM